MLRCLRTRGSAHLIAASCLLAVAACEDPGASAYARRITLPEDLIGGPGATGGVGDYLIGNDQFRVVIEDKGWSRGDGMFAGGGIVDVDLTRPGGIGTADGGKGRDDFGELFPLLFLRAFKVQDRKSLDLVSGKRIEEPAITVEHDGSHGEDAVIRTRAVGGDFFTLLKLLVDAALPPSGLRFETDYVVSPHTRYVKIIGRLHNDGSSAVDLPDAAVAALLQGRVSGLQVPLGDVTLFSRDNQVFAPGAVMRTQALPPGCAAPCPKPVGFDIRYAMEAAYRLSREQIPPPTGQPIPFLVPGLVADFLATASDHGVSYGFAAADSDNNYVWNHRDEFRRTWVDPQFIPDAETMVSKHAVLVPFLVQSFTGVFYELPPPSLPPGGVFEYTRYFIVGTGDVASIRDTLYEIRANEARARGERTPTLRRLRGRVTDSRTGRPVLDAKVHILDARGRPFSEAQVDGDGWFIMKLEPGRYTYRVTAPGRHPFPSTSDLQYFDMTGDRVLRLDIPPPAELVVRTVDTSGRPLPAKVSLVAKYEQQFDGVDPLDFLFDLSLGEGRRSTDLTWRDPAGTRTRQYVELTFYSHGGTAQAWVKPSCMKDRCRPYDVVVSRGPEYSTFTIPAQTLMAGERRELVAVLERVVDTPDWVSADFHVHAIGSSDSSLPNAGSANDAAGEGVEIPVSTDHNYISDYQPDIAAQGLGDWLSSMSGVEQTTLEMGHFNAFPLEVNLAAPTHLPFVAPCTRLDDVNRSSFDWTECKPGQIFDNLRALGRYGRQETIIQVNHPRDSITGYFNQYTIDPYVVQPTQAQGLFVPQDRTPGQFKPESFSWDFDALEVFNSKRLDQLHAFRLPINAPQAVIDRLRACPDGHPANGPGQILLDKNGLAAFPGAVDDWLRMLNAGRTFTATGNSDSHGASADAIGSPRNYLRLDNMPDSVSPSAVSDLDVVHAIKAHRVIATNGPFLTMSVVTTVANGGSREWPVGSTVDYPSDSRGGSVRVSFQLKKAPWVKVDRIIVYANAKQVDEIAVPPGVEFSPTRTYPGPSFLAVYPGGFDRDFVLVAEAVGTQALFPVVTPQEDPPTALGPALASLTASIGLAGTFLGTGDGITGPDYVQKVPPYAITNPIWLNLDATHDPAGTPTWDPPGNESGPGPGCP